MSILNLLERLAEMFPNQDYHSRMERYIRLCQPQSAAEIDHCQRQFERNEFGRLGLWKNFLNQYWAACKTQWSCEQNYILKQEDGNNYENLKENLGLFWTVWSSKRSWYIGKTRSTPRSSRPYPRFKNYLIVKVVHRTCSVLGWEE